MDDNDCCRICRLGDEDQDDGELPEPLRRPCACAGSIALVHQSCLNDWLEHSPRSAARCEVCGTPYQFKKVYRDGQPKDLSPAYVALRAVGATLRAALFGVRAIVVASLWIVVLPYSSTWFLRGFLHSGNHLITAILHLFGLAVRGVGLLDITAVNATDASNALRQFRRVLADVFAATNGTVAASANVTAVSASTRNGTWTDTAVSFWERHREGVTRDVVSGQIMTCSLVVALVAAFMLREFVMQAMPLPVDDAPAEPEPDVPQILALPLPAPPPPDSDDSEPPSPNDSPPPSLAHPHDVLFEDDDDELPPLEMLAPRRIAPLPRRARTATPEASTSGPQSPDESVASTSGGPPLLPSPSVRRVETDDGVRTWTSDWSLADTIEGIVAERRAAGTAAFDSGDFDGDEDEDEMDDAEDELDEEDDDDEDDVSDDGAGGWVDDNPFGALAVDEGDDEEEDLPALVPIEDVPIALPPAPFEALQPRPPPPPPDIADDGMLDVEAVFEAIGFTGDLIGLVQNFALVMLFVALLVLGVLAFPFTIGQYVATSRMPDLIWTAIGQPPFEVLGLVAAVVGARIGPIARIVVAQLPTSLSERLTQVSSTSSSLVTARLATIVRFVQAIPPALASYRTLAHPDTLSERIACTAFGWAILIGGLGAWYVRARYSGRVDDRVGEFIRTNAIVAKVGVFIAVEIVLFPLFCGVLLDLSTIPLFPGVTVASRIAFCQRAPLSAAFMLWSSGSWWMFGLSGFISFLRDQFRAGALHFVKDPQSDDAQPIRDLVEAPTKAQISRLGRSALMYGSTILISLGTLSWGGRYFFPGALPLRWHPGRPHSTLPWELAILHFVAPAVLHIASHNYQWCEGALAELTRFVARQLRLSSYLFDTRKDDEEGRTQWIAYWHRLSRLARVFRRRPATTPPPPAADFQVNGSLARVPANDHVKPGRDRPLVVYLDFDGKALETDAHANDDGWKIVYLPPHWQLRLVTCVYVVWLIIVSHILVMATLFVLLGRFFITASTSEGVVVGDVYAFALGLIHCDFIPTLVVPALLSLRALARAPSWWGVVRASTVVIDVAELVYRAGLLLVIAPLLVGVGIDVYRTAIFSPYEEPTLWLAYEWLLGAFTLGLVAGLIEVLPIERLDALRQTIQHAQDHLYHLDLLIAARISNAFAPALVRALVAALAWPIAVVSALGFVMGDDYGMGAAERKRWAFASSLVGMGWRVVGPWARSWASDWLEAVRDEKFVVKRELLDFEPGAAPAAT